MEVRAHRVGLALRLDLEGRLTIDADTARMPDVLRAALEDDAGGVVVDLAKVPEVDCWGLGQLVRLRNRVHEAGRAFSLVNVPPHVRRLLQLSGLLAVVPVVDGWQDAVTRRPDRPSAA